MKYKHIETGEVVAAEQLAEGTGPIETPEDKDASFWLAGERADFIQSRGPLEEFAEGTFVIVHADGTIKTAHPDAFAEQWKKVK